MRQKRRLVASDFLSDQVWYQTRTTTKPRFREGGNTLTKYSFTLTKMIRDGQPSHNSSHGNEITKIQFS